MNIIANIDTLCFIATLYSFQFRLVLFVSLCVIPSSIEKL
jgi:hypothetical protein